MKVCIVARQPILNPNTQKRYSDEDLRKFDGILYGPVHVVDEITMDLQKELRIEFEKLYPDFGNADYEVVSKQ